MRFHCNPHEIFKIWKLQATYHAHDCAHMAATTTTLSARFKDAYEPLFSNSSSLPVWTDDDSRLFESFQYPQTLEKNGSFVAKFAFSFKNAYQFLREPLIEGVLVGSASVRARQFADVIDASIDAMEGEAVA